MRNLFSIVFEMTDPRKEVRRRALSSYIDWLILVYILSVIARWIVHAL